MQNSDSDLRGKCSKPAYDAVIIGAGPNGLSAAVVLAQKGMSVLVVEAKASVGGGCRSAELTLPGFMHDICSSIYPLGIGSPFFRTLPLQDYGLRWIHPEAPYAHPLNNGKAIVVERSIEKTAAQMGADQDAYYKLMTGLTPDWDELSKALLDLRQLAKYPFPLAKFGWRAMQSASMFARLTFKQPFARAAFAGVAAHCGVPLSTYTSASIGLALGIAAHAVGWPMVQGGSQQLTNALAAHFQKLGGEIILDCNIESLTDLPPARLILCDVTPKQLLKLASHQLPSSYKKQLQNFKYGGGVFKIDWALDGPIPWQAEECARAATVHIGGTLEEIEESEAAIWQGLPNTKPYVLLTHNSPFDKTRSPRGKHTAWAYCHTANNAQENLTEVIEQQVERFAPGFKKLILQRSTINAAAMENYNANYIGGDINGGALLPTQVFTRPVFRLIPFATPVKGLYLCSSSTPPGSGVHGMCGYYAAMCAWHGWQ